MDNQIEISQETIKNTNRLDRFDKDLETIVKEMKEISHLINTIEGKINDTKHINGRHGDDIEGLIMDVKSLWDKYRTLEKDLIILENKLSDNKGKIATAERLFWILLTAIIPVILNYTEIMK
jgi:chromosome segregation ATPase